MEFIKDNNTRTTIARGEQVQIGAPNLDRQPQNVTLVAVGNNEINNYAGINAVIKTGSGNNKIIVNTNSRKTFVETGAGDDVIKIWSEDATIKFGGGSNEVQICADTKILLDVGTCDDYELQYFNRAKADITLTDGNGNYTVRGNTGVNVFDYTIPDSNLVIEAYGGEDLIRIRQPTGEPKVSGNDVVIPVGRGRVVVKNARAHAINLNGRQIVVGTYPSGFSPHQVIKKFMAALNRSKLRGIEAVNEAVRKSSNFSDIDEVITCMINDCKRIRNAEKFLHECCNIVYDNADTGAITGWDAGGMIVKTNKSIVAEHGAVKKFTGNSFTVNGLKVNVPSNLRGVQQDIINGLYTWWVKEALDLVEESYGVAYRFDTPKTSVREIDVEFFNENSHWLANVSHSYSNSTGRAVEMTLRINMKFYSELNPYDPNGSSGYNHNNERATFLDRTLAHEFTHAAMAANIEFFHELPAWLKEGTAEMTHGIADERRMDLQLLASDPNKLYKALHTHTTNASSIAISGVYSPVYAGGFMLLNYFAKKVSNTR